MKHLPGNPFDPRIAEEIGKTPLPTSEFINDAVSEIGLTDTTMTCYYIERLTHAVMALAYEQRTANLIALGLDYETPQRMTETKS